MNLPPTASQNLVTQRERVVLVHGLWMPGGALTSLNRKLTAAGFETHVFEYPTLRSRLRDNTRALAEFLDSLGKPDVSVVGFSLGGVVAMHALREYFPGNVRRVVCMGSPLAGSRAARRLGRQAWGRVILGETLLEGAVKRPLSRVPVGYDVGVIAGTRPRGAGRALVRRIGINDGVVAVAETRLPGLADHLEMPLSHTRMIFSERVAVEVANFLREGRFTTRGHLVRSPVDAGLYLAHTSNHHWPIGSE